MYQRPYKVEPKQLDSQTVLANATWGYNLQNAIVKEGSLTRDFLSFCYLLFFLSGRRNLDYLPFSPVNSICLSLLTSKNMSLNVYESRFVKKIRKANMPWLERFHCCWIEEVALQKAPHTTRIIVTQLFLVKDKYGSGNGNNCIFLRQTNWGCYLHVFSFYPCKRQKQRHMQGVQSWQYTIILPESLSFSQNTRGFLNIFLL